MDSPVAIVLLSLIATATVAQAILVAVLLARGRETVARLEAIERDLRPHLARMGDVIENVAELAEGAARRLPEIESVVHDTVGKVRWAGDVASTLAWAPLLPLARGLALWRAVKRGAALYRRSREPRALPNP
jgi:ABC-type transporter Mla subunit MlaD